MMRKICVIFVVWMVVVSVEAQVTYQRADSIKICKLLAQANQQSSTLWFARQFMGIPYVAHTLEVNTREQLVVNTRQLGGNGDSAETLCQSRTAFVERLCANAYHAALSSGRA